MVDKANDVLDTEGEEILENQEREEDADYMDNPGDAGDCPDSELSATMPKGVVAGELERRQNDGTWVLCPVNGIRARPIAMCSRQVAAEAYGPGRYRYRLFGKNTKTNRQVPLGFSKWFTIGGRPRKDLGGASNTPRTEPPHTENRLQRDFPAGPAVPATAEWPVVPASGPARDLAGMTAPVLNLMRGIALLIHESSAPIIAQARADAQSQLEMVKAQHETSLARDRAFYESVLHRDRQWTETLASKARVDADALRQLQAKLETVQAETEEARAAQTEPASNHWDAISAILEKSPELIDRLSALLGKGGSQGNAPTTPSDDESA